MPGRLEADRLQQTQQQKGEEAQKTAVEETKEQVAKENIDVNGVLGVQQDGYITDHMCPEADAASKSKVRRQMNMATQRNNADLEHSMLLAAAAILRNSLIVVGKCCNRQALHGILNQVWLQMPHRIHRFHTASQLDVQARILKGLVYSTNCQVPT